MTGENPGMRYRQHLWAALIVLAALGGTARAGVIGQWSGSALDYNNVAVTWNNAQFYSKVHTLMEYEGYSVGPDVEAVASNLAAYDSFVIAGARRNATATELADLGGWVASGGLLMVFTDASFDKNPLNALLSGIGSSLSLGGSMDQNFFLKGGVFATTSPGNIAGAFMSGTPGTKVSGGTALSYGGAGWTDRQKSDAAAYVHFEQIGLGYIFVFGDRLDNNYFTFGEPIDHASQTLTPRANLFVNLGGYMNPHGATSGGGNTPADPDPDPVTDPVGDPVPEPGSAVLAGIGLASALAARRLRRR